MSVGFVWQKAMLLVFEVPRFLNFPNDFGKI